MSRGNLRGALPGRARRPGRRRPGPGGRSEPRSRCRRDRRARSAATAKLVAGLLVEVAPCVHRDNDRGARPGRAAPPRADAWRRRGAVAVEMEAATVFHARPPPRRRRRLRAGSSGTRLATGAGSGSMTTTWQRRSGVWAPWPRRPSTPRYRLRGVALPPERRQLAGHLIKLVLDLLEALRQHGVQAAGEAIHVVAGGQVQVPASRWRPPARRAHAPRAVQRLVHPGVVDEQLSEVAQRPLASRGDPILRMPSPPLSSISFTHGRLIYRLERGYRGDTTAHFVYRFSQLCFWR